METIVIKDGNMNCKIHINLHQGTLEAEGSESFVTLVYKDFREILLNENSIGVGQPTTAVTASNNPAENKVERISPAAKGRAKSKAAISSSKESLAVDTQFFSGAFGKKFLTEIKNYDIPANHQKKVTLFVYVMQKIGMSGITLSHIFTAYRLLTEKTPGFLRQTITDAKNKNVWLVNDSWEDIRTHHKGDEMVEHELVKGKAAA